MTAKSEAFFYRVEAAGGAVTVAALLQVRTQLRSPVDSPH